MANATENTEKKDWIFIRTKGDPAVKEAILHTDNIIYSYKLGAYLLPKIELQAAHPGIKAGFITDHARELFIKDFKGAEIDSTTRNSIGTCYSPEVGEKIFEEKSAKIKEALAKKGSQTEAKEDVSEISEPVTEEKVAEEYTKAANKVYMRLNLKTNPTLLDAVHKTPGMHYQASTKTWNMPKDQLASAHPQLKSADVHIFDNYGQIFKNHEQAVQIDGALRESIGTQYNEALGNKLFAEYKAKHSDKNTQNKTQTQSYSHKKTATKTQTKEPQKQVQKKQYNNYRGR